MKNYEKESLFKNFFVFFSLLEILLILLFIVLYHTKKTEYKYALLQNMRVCSYSLNCENYDFDFVPKGKHILDKLYEDYGAYAYFTIPKSKKYYMKISYAPSKLTLDINHMYHTLLFRFILATLLLFVVALFFTFYSLNPIRKALRLNDEFIKDILHDFNTPIASMILNIKMFKDEHGQDENIERVSHSMENIVHLQSNLKSFLDNTPTQNQTINIENLIEERLKNLQNMYPNLTFVFNKKNSLYIYTNHELCIRILDNLLSNAIKYNKPKGKVILSILNETLTIEDTGKGIYNVTKVFQRYYKEQDRGLGLGLHIVKKLCDELNIQIDIKSQINIGTKVILNFKYLRKGLLSKA